MEWLEQVKNKYVTEVYPSIKNFDVIFQICSKMNIRLDKEDLHYLTYQMDLKYNKSYDNVTIETFTNDLLKLMNR